jgi:broad specificity phosphatase PhoE
MTILLARHGECTASGTYCGRTDAPLTAKGREQAAALAETLSRYDIVACYASPLLRAVDTARTILRDRAISLTIDDRLREFDFGSWEGLRYAEIEARWPALARDWLGDPTAVAIPGGERFSSLRERVHSFLRERAAAPANRDVLVVAHGGALAAIVLETLHLPARDFFKHVPGLGSLSRVDITRREVVPC